MSGDPARPQVVQADLDDPRHREMVLEMVRGYARDSFGDGRDLPEEVRGALVEGLRSHPTTLVFLALLEDAPIGIAVCFRGFSTFAARPLINIHDLYVAEGHRGRGAGRLLLQAVEDRARALGYCKLTLEVQEENRKALGLYESFGFRDPSYGGEGRRTLFRHKKL